MDLEQIPLNLIHFLQVLLGLLPYYLFYLTLEVGSRQPRLNPLHQSRPFQNELSARGSSPTEDAIHLNRVHLPFFFKLKPASLTCHDVMSEREQVNCRLFSRQQVQGILKP